MTHSEIAPTTPLFSKQREKEIDLLVLMEHLFAARKWIIAITLACAIVGLIVSLLLPQRWTSESVIMRPEQVQIVTLRETLARMQALDLDIKETRDSLFLYFIKEFASRSGFENWLINSPDMMQALLEKNADAEQMHAAILSQADKLQVQNESDPKNAERKPYAGWKLSFSADSPELAQKVLTGYTQFVTEQVRQDVMDVLKQRLEFRIDFEKQKLALTREALGSEHQAKIERLQRALKIANAAGIKKPVYSTGERIQDDPDYSIALGSDGLIARLEVEKSLNDIEQMNAAIRDQKYHLAQLSQLTIPKIDFTPFKYHLSPSLPVQHDGPGKGPIILLAALLGFVGASAGVLFRQARLARHE